MEEIIEPVVTKLLSGLQNRFLNETAENMALYNELYFLDLKALKKVLDDGKREEISLKLLCELNNIEDEGELVNELCDFRLKYATNENSCNSISLIRNDILLTKGLEEANHRINSENDAESDEELEKEDERTYADATTFYVDSEDDLDEEIIVHGKKFSTIKCYCLQCVLKYFNTVKQQYPNLHILYKFIAILPATQVKCERDFSSLKIIKNYRRTLLNESTLHSIMILYLESDLFENINLDDIIDELAKTSPLLAKELF